MRPKVSTELSRIQRLLEPTPKRSRNMSRPSARLSLAIALIAVASQAITGTSMAQPASETPLAPLMNEAAPSRVPDRYIVVMKEIGAREAAVSAQERVKSLGGKIVHSYDKALNGFTVTLPKGAEGAAALQTLRAMPGVAYIEADQMGSGNVLQPPNPPTAPPPGLDRIDRRLLPLNGSYSYSETGAGVHAYVIDSGVRATHSDFGGRASGAVNFVADANGTNDCHGHGTNVAGIIGGEIHGVAKGVTLHAVRVLDCSNRGFVSDFIAGINWVTANALRPAVANLSLSSDSPSTALDTAVANSITASITYTIAAANNNGADACNVSPARVPAAITVGATDPNNDTRAGFSNIGACLDLFAPGVNILSAGIANDTATSVFSGTSQAAPHVAGVAARYLQNHPAATPAQVWTAIHAADDVATTPGWGGVVNAGAGSPNELLHWGSLNDGQTDGDPHLTTVEGVHYDFQSAGEFVALRGDGIEIQTRQTPIATSFTLGPNGHTGLTTCVSINTAVAAKIGTHRVSYQPDGVPNPKGLQLRVDGVLTVLDPKGVDLAGGGRIVKSPLGDGIEVIFPNATTLIATPGWWEAQQKWYLNLRVVRTAATAGILGEVTNGWLPALPDGSSLGSRPRGVHERYVSLYDKFVDAWRVTDATSLFDYGPGSSTATFTLKEWPKENPSSCILPAQPVAQPLEAETAGRRCAAISDRNAKANCIFDVMVTGHPGFGQTYLLAQRLQPGATEVVVKDDKDPTGVGVSVTFTATVSPAAPRSVGSPTGKAQFVLDGNPVGQSVALDASGKATWTTLSLKAGVHTVVANYLPTVGGAFLPSGSPEARHTVESGFGQWLWLLAALVILILLIWVFLRA